MIERIAIDLADQMTEAKLIDKEVSERYSYVLISWMERFVTIGTIILISIAVHMFLPTSFFLIFFLALRKRTGGYHLDKFYQCYFSTIVSYLIISAICSGFVNYPKQLFVILLLAIGAIGIIGTVNHPNMHMDSEELAESKSAARTIVLLEGSIICCCVLLGADKVFIGYMEMAVILCAVLLCIAKIFKQEVKENEEGK